MYSERTLRRRADAIGYRLEKGFVHQLVEGYPVWDREVGYNIIDNEYNYMVYGCYNNVFDHLFTLEDVEDFLKTEYVEAGLKW